MTARELRGVKNPHPLGSVPSRSGVSELTAESGVVGPGVKISALPVATLASATDELEANQAGTTRSITLDLVSTVVAASGQITGSVTLAVPTLAALQALVAPYPTTVTTAWRAVPNDGGGGTWSFLAGDQSAAIAADSLSGVYAAPNSDPSGASGAWRRQFSGGISVQWYGARGDNATDDTAALQAALNHATNVGYPGLDVNFPPGQYVHSGLVIGVDGDTTKGYARMVAYGSRSTTTTNGVILKCTSGSANHLTIYDSQAVGIHGIAFAAADTVVPTSLAAGAAVLVMRGQRLVIDQLRIDHCFNGLDIFGNRNALVTNADIVNCAGAFGFRIKGDSTHLIARGTLENISISPGQIDTVPGSPTQGQFIATRSSKVCDGFIFGDYCNSIDCRWIGTTWGKHGLVIGEGGDVDPAKRPVLLRFNEVGIENSDLDGIWFRDGSHIFMSETYSCLNGGNPVDYTNPSGPVTVGNGVLIGAEMNLHGGVVWINGGKISTNAGHGISGEGTCALTLNNCRMGSASTRLLSNTKDAINVSAATFFLYLLGNRLGGNTLEIDNDDTGTWQRFGVRLEPTFVSGIVQIDANNLGGNVTNAISDAAGPLVVRRFAESNVATGAIVSNIPTGSRNQLINGGFEVWQRGTSTLLAGTSPHGMVVDRWSLFVGSAGASATASQVAGLNKRSRYALRVQRTAGNAINSNCLLEQTFTSEQVAALRGATLALSFLCRIGADWTSLTISVVMAFGTGAPSRKGVGTYTNQTRTPGSSVQLSTYGRSSTVITNITNANPARVTLSASVASKGFQIGSRALILGVGGMTQVNNKTYRVDLIPGSPNDFYLDGVDSTAYGAYTSGGTAIVWPVACPCPVTGITNANPAVVTCVGHGFATGQHVMIEGTGMTGTTGGLPDQIDGTLRRLTIVDDSTFSLDVDTTGWSAYTSGGVAYPISRLAAAVPLAIPDNATQGCIQINFVPTATAAGANEWIDIDDVQLEFGQQSTEFERRLYTDELLACRRHYRKSFAQATVPAQNAGTTGALFMQLPTGASGTFGMQVLLDPPMMAAPTVVTYNPSATNANWRDATGAADRVVTVAGASDSGFEVTGAAGVAGSANRIHWTAESDFP